MANVKFKWGLQADLKALASYDEGCFYLTKDTDRLYVAQSTSELVELNKSITVVDNINKLPTARNSSPEGGINGSEVEVGQFYYVKAGAGSVSGNILAVCDSIGSGTSGAIHWTQINPDTNDNDNTFATGITFSKDNTSSNANQLVFNVAIGQSASHATGSNSVEASATGTLTISSSDITNIVTQTAVDLKKSAVASNKTTVSTTGSGAAGNGFTIEGSSTVTLSDVTGGLKIDAKNTTYSFAMPAVSGATATSTAAIEVSPSEGSAYNLNVKVGEDLAINNATSGEFTIYHKASGVTAATYGNSATAPAAGGTFTVPKFTVDAQGHISSASDQTITLPGDVKVTGVSVTTGSNNQIIISQSAGSDIKSTSGSLYYKINKYDGAGNATTATVYNGESFGDFYTKAAIDAKLQSLDALTYKGTIGSSGATVSALPSKPSNGDTYKVATAGTYDSKVCEVGDLLIATGSEGTDGTISSPTWTLISNGDDTDTTYTFSVSDNAIKVTPKGGSLTTIATIAGGNKITAGTNGTTITLSHDTVNGLTTGTYGLTSNTSVNAAGTVDIPKVTVDAYGHVTAISNSTLTLPNAASLSVNTAAAGLVFNPGSGSNVNISVTGGTAISTTASGNTITINHASVTHTTANEGGTNGTGLNAEGTFDVVSGVTVNDQGHVTNVTFQKYKLPADNNTTYTLSATGSASTGSILLHPSAGSDMSVGITSNNLTVSTSGDNINLDLVWGTF